MKWDRESGGINPNDPDPEELPDDEALQAIEYLSGYHEGYKDAFERGVSLGLEMGRDIAYTKTNLQLKILLQNIHDEDTRQLIEELLQY